MLLYRTLTEAEIERNLFASFIRRQIVVNCVRRKADGWTVQEDPFVDDWTEEDYSLLIACLKRTVRTGGFVYAAFCDEVLKGFVSVEPEGFGGENRYLDLSALHVSEDMRRHGIGNTLFQAAKYWAVEKGARKLYISAHSAVESQAFYRAMGCVEACEYHMAHVKKEPYDCQLECVLEPRMVETVCHTARLDLVMPTLENKQDVMEYRAEMLQADSHFDGCAGLETCESYEEWLDFERRLKGEYGDSYVPSRLYLAFRRADHRLVGMLDHRIWLSDFLVRFGGQIGYSVRPSERQQGYANEMLAAICQSCRTQGIHRLLVTCDRENVASAKTILANGGVLENEVEDLPGLGVSGTIQRYWIDLHTVQQ